MHRIVIDLYDHTSDADAAEFAREIIATFSPSNRVRVERVDTINGVTETTFDSERKPFGSDPSGFTRV